jgi:hypothetical protein
MEQLVLCKVNVDLFHTERVVHKALKLWAVYLFHQTLKRENAVSRICCFEVTGTIEGIDERSVIALESVLFGILDPHAQCVK